MAELTSERIRTLLSGPAAPPPTGAVSNLEHPKSMEVNLLVAASSSLLIATLPILLRLWTKLRLTREWLLEDHLCIVAYVLYIAMVVPCYILRIYSPGAHMWNTRLAFYSKLLYWLRIDAILDGFVIFGVKATILLQFLRIFNSIEKAGAMYWTSHVLIWTNAAFYTVMTFIETFSCRPIAKAWNPLIQSGSCFSILITYTASAVINAASDLLIAMLPQRSVWKLHLVTHKKLKASAILMATLIPCAAGLIQIYYAVKAYQTNDVSHYMCLFAIWRILEVAFGFFAACLPSMGLFLLNFQKSKPATPLNVKTHLQPFPPFSNAPDDKESGRYENAHKEMDRDIGGKHFIIITEDFELAKNTVSVRSRAASKAPPPEQSVTMKSAQVARLCIHQKDVETGET